MGLGRNEDGRTTNIAVAMKLDQLGIGAGRTGAVDKDGIAWKQQNEFERMLARLNSVADGDPQDQEPGVVAALGFTASTQSMEITPTASTSTGLNTSSDLKKEKKKRKRNQFEMEEESSSTTLITTETSVSASSSTTISSIAVAATQASSAPRRFA